MQNERRASEGHSLIRREERRGEEWKGIIVVTEKKLKFVQRSQNTPKLGGWTDGGLRKRIGQTASTECDPYDENLTTPSYA